MLFSASDASLLQPLQSLQINNQNNNGLIGNGSNNIVNSGNIIIDINDWEDELERLLGRHLSKDALHDSFYSCPECHPNTRTTIRNEIGQWIDKSGFESSPLLWLNGPAGVGKSAIAKTISVSHDQVVATFFFSTSSDRSAATLFPTLAWQMARRIPDTREHIIASLKASGSLQTRQIEEQFELLILQPLKSIMTLRYRPIMVIDGVDECIDESMLARFLRVLVRAGEDGSMPVHFLICSRPEPRIRTILGKACDLNPTTDGPELRPPSLLSKVIYLLWGLELSRYHSRSEPHLHTQQGQGFPNSLQGVREQYQSIRLGIDKHTPSSDTSNELSDMLDRIYPHPVISTIQIGFSEECKQDIARYLTDIFHAIPRPGGGTSPWFRPSDISDLVEASCGQFLYASTIARLLDEPYINPWDVLEMARRGSLPTPDLNKLYKAILKRAQDTTRNQAQDGGPDYQTEWRYVMDSLKLLVFFAGNVHFFTVSKSFPVIESLLGLDSGKLTRKLGKMHSVLNIVPGETVQMHHRSFLEFLQSRERSGEYHIPFSTAMRRILILLVRAGLRYFKDNDNRRRYIEDMVVACRDNFLGRFKFPLRVLHLIVHVLIISTISTVSMLTAVLMLIALRPSFSNTLLLATLLFLLMIAIFLGFCGSFILSLTAYAFFFNRFIIVPFFHPFLHPLFVHTDGFLVPSQLPFLFILIIVSLSVIVLTQVVLSRF